MKMRRWSVPVGSRFASFVESVDHCEEFELTIADDLEDRVTNHRLQVCWTFSMEDEWIHAIR